MLSQSIDFSPSNSPIVIGKKQTIATSIILEMIPYPNHSTNSGAMATAGTVCVRIRIGYIVLLINSNLSIKKDIINATKIDISNPSIASLRVVVVFLIRLGKSSQKASATSLGDGSIKLGSTPTLETYCHIIMNSSIKKAGKNLYENDFILALKIKNSYKKIIK